MHTPNLDRLATHSLLLRRAYVQQAVCSPSRTSLLTGRRPDTTRVHDLLRYWRTAAGNFTTLPQYFKDNGYRTAGAGKVFHPGRASGGHDDPLSWTEPYFNPDQKYWDQIRQTWYPVDDEEARDNPLPDMQITRYAVELLTNLSASSDMSPFFLAVGFLRPHLPFVFPKRFLDYYPPTSVRLPSNPYAPTDMPEIAWSNFDEIRKYSDIENKYGYGTINTTFPNDVTLELRRAYYASVSFVDALVGELLDAILRLGIGDNTIVSFVGDHGWQLGEHGEWCKHTNFEIATRAPVILRVPGVTDRGHQTGALIEFVDLFPTIAEAAGLRVPELCPENSMRIPLCVEGVSFMRLLNNSRLIPWKKATFSQYPRMIVSGDVIMGYSVRTDNFRYTEWVRYDTVTYTPIWTKGFDRAKGHGTELYDHRIDADENVNIAYEERYSTARRELRVILRTGWRAAIPPN